ncbi:MAG: hypothetical protein AAFR74_06695 [Pseudomonadota bacterium]
MNPYARFGLVSNTVSAALILTGLAVFGSTIIDAASGVASGGGTAAIATLATIVTVMVVFWLAMTEAIFPALFRFNSVRRLVLGKYYFEGTWLQSEKGESHARLSVIDIQPQGKGFIFSGYSLNEDLEIESNTLIEFSKLDWPFMTYKYRNSLSDGGDGKREGVGEIQFEMNKASARRYNGYVQYVRNEARVKIEGAKLTSNGEVKQLRTLQGRQKVFSKYWDLFFNSSIRKPERVVEVVRQEVVKAEPAEIEETLERLEETATKVERRKAQAPSKEAIVPRRRASDWAKDKDTFKGEPLEDETPLSGTGK